MAFTVMHASLPFNGEALLWGVLIVVMAAMFGGAPVVIHFAGKPPKPKPGEDTPTEDTPEADVTDPAD